MKKIIIFVVGWIILTSVFDGNASTGFGAAVLLAGGFYALKLFAFGTKAAARATGSAISTAMADRRNDKIWQRDMARELERETKLMAARNQASIALFREQIALMQKYKSEGLVIEQQVIEMRRQLLEFESKENAAMIHQLISTLDAI